MALRLFTGFSLEYSVRRNLELMLEHFAPLAPLRWTAPDNFHITTCFIGTWPEERLDELKQALAGVKYGGEFTVRVEGLGWFDNPHHPRSLFAAVKPPEPLAEAKRKTAEALASLGLAMETKPYVPHVTLARIKDRTDLAPLRRAIAELPSNEFGHCRMTRHLLYRSELRPAGSVYAVSGEFPLE
jgi:2'-5' RNA ligase